MLSEESARVCYFNAKVFEKKSVAAWLRYSQDTRTLYSLPLKKHTQFLRLTDPQRKRLFTQLSV